MRHMVSHSQDGHIQMALVDDDSGELTQIGQFIWPEGFGLSESAVLSSNLSSFFGLNGGKRRTQPARAALPVGTHQPVLEPERRTNASAGRPRGIYTKERQDTVLAYLAEHPHASTADMGQAFGIPEPSNSWIRKALIQLMNNGKIQRHGLGAHDDRQGRPFTYTLTGGSNVPKVNTEDADVAAAVAERHVSKRAKAKAQNKVGRYISDDEVLAVIAHYPEGLTARQIGERIWRLTDGRGADDEEVPRWVVRSVENRVAMMQYRAKSGKTPLPYRLDYRDEHRGSGPTKYMLPL